jgi:hypothetical protein
MKERERTELSELLPETRSILEGIEAATGVPMEIQAEPRVRGKGRAIYAATDPDPTRHLILYDPSEREHLDHLIAHECGHLRRFDEARPEDRKVPVVSVAERIAAARQFLPSISRLIESGFPEGAAANMLPVWVGGTVSQLANTPSDVRIEEDLWRDYPGLRDRQRASLIHQIKMSHQGLRPVVAAFTPETVWLASNAMNYVLAKSVARLLKMPALADPYRRHPEVRSLGQSLLEVIEAQPDAGLAGDHAISDMWADRLGIRGWFEWKRLDELPAGAKRSWEADS